MSVYTLQNAKDLHATNRVLYPLSGIRQLPILLTLFSREGRRPRRLVGGDGMSMASPQTLITGIPDQGRVVGKPYARLTEELQVMNRTGARGRTQNALCHRTHQHLEFQGVPLLLAAVPAPLLFLGRSHGTSEASTVTMLYTICAS